jgi:hypothetical protein
MTDNREPPQIALKNQTMERLGLVFWPVSPVVRFRRRTGSLEVDEYDVGTLREARGPIAPGKGGGSITVDH